MDIVLSKADDDTATLEDYIKYIHLRLKNPNTQDIPISNGVFIEFWEEYPIYKFKISRENSKRLKNIYGEYWLGINGQRKECSLIDSSDCYVSIWVKDSAFDTKSDIQTASIKIDMSFVLKRQLRSLEQLKDDRYGTIRKYLFSEVCISNSVCADCSFENHNLNEGQIDAIQFAVGVKDFYLIWGPPGTGKTTIIPELVLNYRRNRIKERGKEPRILVCSWTNAAVDNVAKLLFGKIDRMVRYGDTSLRKKEVRDKYKSILFEEQIKSKKHELEKTFNGKFYVLKEKMTAIELKIKSVEGQQKLLVREKEPLSLKCTSFDGQMKLLKMRISHEKSFSSLYKRIFQRSKHEEEIARLQRQLNYISSKKTDLFKQLKSIENSIFDIEVAIAESNENRKAIANELNKLHKNKALALENIEIDTLNENFAILTTNLRTAGKIFENITFDIIVMDEAGAIDLPSAVVVLLHSNKVVFIGDHKQLSPVIPDSLGTRDFIESHPKVKSSIFEILYKKDYEKDRLIMLENQYRMKKVIANFISKQFYDDRIRSPIEIHTALRNTKDEVLNSEYPLILFERDFRADIEGKSLYNLLEIRLIKNIIARFVQEYGDEIKNKISVITPYRAQLEHLKEAIPNIDCGTVHTYQGQEREIIIFSTVKYRKNATGFGPLFEGEKGNNLLNVAMSRAKEKFIIIGGYSLFNNVKTYNELYKYTENYGLIIKELIPEYDTITLNKCSICGGKIEPYQTQCSDCKQLYIMQTMQEQRPRSKKCVDGDLVRSIGEVLIDNWLHSNNIKHQVEQKVPILQLMYCDWYLPDYDTYIEFWGDIHIKDPEKRRVKERLYQKNKLKLVGIEVIDTDNLDEILRHKLKCYLDKVQK